MSLIISPRNILSRNLKNPSILKSFRTLSSLGSGDDISAPSISETDTTSIPVSKPFLFREVKDLANLNVKLTPVREAWVEDFVSETPVKLGIIQLHPKVFGAFPRTDIIFKNMEWQRDYRKIDWTTIKTRAELPGSNKKPWPQKGTGKKRAGSLRAPHFTQGGWANPPRGPDSKFYMLDFETRLNGLISTLSAKLAQDDIKIIDTLEHFPSEDGEYLEKVCESRGWGPSVLFVDRQDLMPKNISLAAEKFNHLTLMPVYSLNVYSMLKYETLVLTVEAVDEIESKLIFQLRRSDLHNIDYKPGSLAKTLIGLKNISE